MAGKGFVVQVHVRPSCAHIRRLHHTYLSIWRASAIQHYHALNKRKRFQTDAMR
jgi:hypothetical protein